MPRKGKVGIDVTSVATDFTPEDSLLLIQPDSSINSLRQDCVPKSHYYEGDEDRLEVPRLLGYWGAAFLGMKVVLGMERWVISFPYQRMTSEIHTRTSSSTAPSWRPVSIPRLDDSVIAGLALRMLSNVISHQMSLTGGCWL